jgi:hypothetical protein
MVDYSDYTGLIPAGTVAVVQMKLRFHDDGTDGVLKLTKAGDAEGLDVEYIVVDWPFAKQKMFAYIMLIGESEGQKQMIEKNQGFLKDVIDSAKFLDPDDRSPEARQKRDLEYRDFDNLRFLALIGVEESKSGYPDKNVVMRAIPKTSPKWGGRSPIEQIPATRTGAYTGSTARAGAGSASGATASSAGPAQGPATIVKPNWARDAQG